MSALRIPCPRCGKSLQLPDRRYLGRRGKCAACGHSFVLNEPEPEVVLQPVEEIPPVAIAAPVAPAVEAVIGTSEPDTSTTLLSELRRKRAKRRRVAIAAGAVMALLIVGAIALIRSQLPTTGTAARNSTVTSQGPETKSAAAAIDSNPVSEAVVQANAELVANARPTHGGPIDLTMLPSGVNLLFHLRPAELWGEAPQFQELRGALTQNVTDWIAQQLQAKCHRQPEQVEEALIGILLGPTGSMPEVAAVVRLKDPAKLSDLVEEFRGEPVRSDGSLRLFRGSTEAYYIKDEKTVAICPADLADDLADWLDQPNQNTTDGFLQLLPLTDRNRLFTVVFEVEDVSRHADWLFSAETLPAFRNVLDLLGEESETACWSVHLNDELHSELHVRTRVAGADDILGPRGLAQLLSTRIIDVPQRLLTAVNALNPQHAGARQLVGRLPAMVEAVRQSTVATTGERHVQFTSLLPAKAAPNLALASLLTWDESRRTTNTSQTAPGATADATQLPNTVAERLKLPVEAEFRRMPLGEALAYICGEIEVSLSIDGDALKDAGYTQNMPQEFNLGKVPAEVAISRIVAPNDGDGKDELRMVVVIDESKKALLVLTKKFADQQGLTPLDLPTP
jgi:hypothetical protein